MVPISSISYNTPAFGSRKPEEHKKGSQNPFLRLFSVVLPKLHSDTFEKTSSAEEQYGEYTVLKSEKFDNDDVKRNYFELLKDERIADLIEDNYTTVLALKNLAKLSEKQRALALEMLSTREIKSAIKDGRLKFDSVLSYDCERVSDEIAEQILKDKTLLSKFKSLCSEVYEVSFDGDILFYSTNFFGFSCLSKKGQELALKILNSNDVGHLSRKTFRKLTCTLDDTSDSDLDELINDKKQFSKYLELVQVSNGTADIAFARCSDDLFDKLYGLLNSGHSVTFQKLQQNSGYTFTTRRNEYDPKFYSVVSIEHAFDLDSSQEEVCRMEICGGNNLQIGRNRAAKSVFYFDFMPYKLHGDNKNALLGSFELILGENGEPLEIISTRISKILENAYKTTRFRLSDYPEDLDIIKAIEDGTIEGEKLSEVVQNPDGSVTLTENYTNNGISIKRNYTQRLADGAINLSGYEYLIQDKDGKELLNLKRSFTKNPDGSTTTVLNGRELKTEFDDNTKTFTIKGENFEKSFCIAEQMACGHGTLGIQGDFNEDSSEEELKAREDVEKFWKTVKQMPADMLLILSKNINIVQIRDENAFNREQKELITNCSLDAIYHELGHSVCDESDKIIKDPELLKNYKEEIQEFNKIHPSNSRDIVDYFSLTGGSIINTGLDELIAEAFLLFTTCAQHDVKLAGRAHYLVRYFPKTIAKIADLAGYNAAV